MKMVVTGASALAHEKDAINKLNVFPVPDGDTGTNMNLTMSSGLKEMKRAENGSFQHVISAFINGLLMGARGNSGVILSQLFRGFSSLRGESVDTISFAKALKEGVEIAYKSVIKPVEGTILTVAKDTAKVALVEANKSTDFVALMEKLVSEANASLDRTPDLLPILKEVGVVDSGGKGFLMILKGFLAALTGKEVTEIVETNFDTQIAVEHEEAVQSFISLDSIKYGYCTEFIVEFDKIKTKKHPFVESEFKALLDEYGDSLLVASSDDLVKIHIHTEKPGKVMSIAQQYGELVNIDIENMRKQYKDIVEQKQEKVDETPLEYAIITVAQGDGLKELFHSIGATRIIDGGQTMNPSTEDFMNEIEKINAKHIFILPNNKNILMAAKQAAELSQDNVVVIPSVTIPQGIKALFEFDEQASYSDNEMNMTEALDEVKTGLITYATRDTIINNIEIKQDEYIGLDDESIIVAKTNKLETTYALLEQLIDEDDEIITVFYGEDVQTEDVQKLEDFVHVKFADVESEFHTGNQSIYSFIIMVE